MNYLIKKNAFISGATSGLGKELAIHLAKKGYHVLIHGRNQNKLNYLYDVIKSLKGKSTIINLDLNDHNGIDKLGHEVYKNYHLWHVHLKSNGHFYKLLRRAKLHQHL